MIQNRLEIKFMTLVFLAIFNLGFSTPIKAAGTNEIDSYPIGYLVFGRYCGECLHNCVVLFRFEKISDKWTLFADLDGENFPDRFEPDFRTNFSDPWRLEIAKEIVERIPQQLFEAEKEKIRFGCPDCADQCGYYVEFSHLSTGEIRKFWLDYVPAEGVPKEVTDFASFIGDQMRMLRH